MHLYKKIPKCKKHLGQTITPVVTPLVTPLVIPLVTPLITPAFNSRLCNTIQTLFTVYFSVLCIFIKPVCYKCNNKMHLYKKKIPKCKKHLGQTITPVVTPLVTPKVIPLVTPLITPTFNSRLCNTIQTLFTVYFFCVVKMFV